MGVTYSSTKLKVQLRTANQRMSMHLNKRNNTIRTDSREVAKLLQQKKDESARLKVEGIIASKNMVICMETLQLMCELLLTRIGVINAAKKECPEDLEESIASIAYCSTRMEVEELTEITRLLAAKFGQSYMTTHLNNESGKVSHRIISKLSVRPPDFDVVINLMQEIAGQYEVDWTPDWSHLESGINSNDPYRLGAVAKIAHSTVPVPEPTEDEVKAMPTPISPAYSPIATAPPPGYQPNDIVTQYLPTPSLPYNPQPPVQPQPQNYLQPQFMPLPTPNSQSASPNHSNHQTPTASPSNSQANLQPLILPPSYAEASETKDESENEETHAPSYLDEIDRFEAKKPTAAVPAASSSSSSASSGNAVADNSEDRFMVQKPKSEVQDDNKDPGEEEDDLERRFRALHQ